MILTEKQQAAQKVLGGRATHLMLFGGSRSGKSALLTRAVAMRAQKAPKSRHAILRFRFNHVKTSVVADTWPKVMAMAFPGVRYEMNRTDWYAQFENGSQVWFGGLDDKERTEKILGNEYATIFLNECSQIPSNSRDIAVTRLAQKNEQVFGDGKGGEIRRPLPVRMYYDCNPTSKAHWSYLRFVKKIDPESKLPLTNPDDYAFFQINPGDNSENLSDGYLETLNGLPARLKRRFLLGEFADATPNALWTDEILDQWRVLEGDRLPDMQRIVIGVDPSGAKDSTSDGDAIGIVVCGLGTDGNGYVLEDLTILAGPAVWGKVVAAAYDRHGADAVVGETNYGGAMVKHVIQTARPRTPYRAVTATRGKAVRAEPISALFDLGKARMVGYHRALEDELTAFSTSGYLGENSPNHADAMVWAMSDLFPGMVKPDKKEEKEESFAQRFMSGFGSCGWMAA